MVADSVLVLSGLVLAHLVADFGIQTDGIAADKGASGRRAWRGLALHGVGVAACLVPFPLVFGLPGIAVLVAITASHVVVDRLKVVATRRAEARALIEAHARLDPSSESPTTLGPAWTPLPAVLFALDQAVHAGVIIAAWAVWLAGAAPLAPAVGAIDGLIGRWDGETVQRVAVAGSVLASVLIVNMRAGALFVSVLVRPRAAVSGIAPGVAGQGHEGEGGAAARGIAWRVRLGPFEATAEQTATAAPKATADQTRTTERSDGRPNGHASPVRVGATIGVLERLLIVALMLTGAQAAVGFVVAAKTIARFKQLDDRDFAEYYLLGTLASVAVALGSALVADAALATVGL